jgi:hypothetical protein
VKSPGDESLMEINPARAYDQKDNTLMEIALLMACLKLTLQGLGQKIKLSRKALRGLFQCPE